jgi:hypothetical protein
MSVGEKKILKILLSLIIIGFVIIAYYSRKPVCVDSNLINEIQISNNEKNDSGDQSIFRCELRHQINYNSDLKTSVEVLNRRIKPIEVFLRAVQPITGGITIKI